MAVSTSSQINELFKNKKLDFSNLLTKALENTWNGQLVRK